MFDLIDNPLLQHKAKQQLELKAYRWQQENGYSPITHDISFDKVYSQAPGGVAALRVTVYQRGSRALIDSAMFELTLDIEQTSLMPEAEVAVA